MPNKACMSLLLTESAIMRQMMAVQLQMMMGE